jgi:peptidase M28-like protein
MRCVALLLAPLLVAAAPAEDRAASWWRHVETLSADAMEGRGAGADGYRRASDYVAARFAEYGLAPAGDGGSWFQAVTLEERAIRPEGTHAALTGAGDSAQPLRMPQDLFFRVRGGPPPERIDAPLVFIGYGVHLPEADRDDLAGIDLAGKVAVVLTADPPGLSGAIASHVQAVRARLLAERGAVGMILVEPETPDGRTWEDFARAGETPGMYPASAAGRPFLTAYFNPIEAEALFESSKHSFAELAELADAGRPLPRFALARRLSATIATSARSIATRNVVARLPGGDPRLAGEHVVLTAHLDHVGIGRPTNGDSIYNGTLDNAAGVGALLDIAEQLRRQGARPRRSLLFVALTAEELGLLGSRWFVAQPTVPRASIVANLNYDMALPLFPLSAVTVLGADESSLGADARAVGAQMGLPVLPDPFPERNSFIRSDQYSFIEAGIPALAFKFGFTAGTPEAEIERNWRARIYHLPGDDLSQTVFREDEIRLHDFIAAIALRIANADARPRWNGDSFFRRFARD